MSNRIPSINWSLIFSCCSATLLTGFVLRTTAEKTDSLSALLFGGMLALGTSQAFLLPFALSQKKWTRESTYKAACQSGVLIALGCIGLYAFSNNPNSYFYFTFLLTPATAYFLGVVTAQQGLDISVGNSRPTVGTWRWSILHIQKDFFFN